MVKSKPVPASDLLQEEFLRILSYFELFSLETGLFIAVGRY